LMASGALQRMLNRDLGRHRPRRCRTDWRRISKQRRSAARVLLLQTCRLTADRAAIVPRQRAIGIEWFDIMLPQLRKACIDRVELGFGQMLQQTTRFRITRLVAPFDECRETSLVVIKCSHVMALHMFV